MGPPPDSWDEDDHHPNNRRRRASLDSCFTTATTTGSESQKGVGGIGGGMTMDNSGRRSQGYVSLTSAASTTYLIDATGADPILLPAHELYSSCYPPEATPATPLCGNGSSSNSYRQQQQQQMLIQRLDNNGFGGPPVLFVPPPPSERSGYTTLAHDDRLGGEKQRSGGKANGRAAAVLPPPPNGRHVVGSGQCNHLSDGCECFRESFPQLPRKVSTPREEETMYIQ